MIRNQAIRVLIGGALVLASCAASASEVQTPAHALAEVLEPGGAVASDLQALPEEPTLEDYLRYAALRNAGLRATYYDWIAAMERVPQAEALPDPNLSYGYYLRSVETRVGAQRHRLGASQMVPWLGKRGLRGDVAAAAAEEKRERFEALKLGLFYRVTEAYAEYYYLGQALSITRENIELLRYWEKLALAKYRVGMGRYPDVIKVQVELGKLDDRERTLEELRGPLVAGLNAALNRPGGALPWPKIIAEAQVSVDTRSVIGQLGSTSPELRALDAAVAKEEHAIALARKDFFPDVTFGLQWIDTASRSVDGLGDNGKDAVIGSFSVNLPVWGNKYGAGVREAEARRAAASERRADRERELASGVALALYKFQDAVRKVNLYGNGLVPKGNESLAATFTAYESGEADSLDLLDAQRTLLDFRLAYQRALADQEQRLAESEMLVGRSLRDGVATESSSEEDKQ